MSNESKMFASKLELLILTVLGISVATYGGYVENHNHHLIECLNSVEPELTGFEVPSEVEEFIKNLNIDWDSDLAETSLVEALDGIERPVACRLVADLWDNFPSEFDCVMNIEKMTKNLMQKYPKFTKLRKAQKSCSGILDVKINKQQVNVACAKHLDEHIKEEQVPKELRNFIDTLKGIDWASEDVSDEIDSKIFKRFSKTNQGPVKACEEFFILEEKIEKWAPCYIRQFNKSVSEAQQSKVLFKPQRVCIACSDWQILDLLNLTTPDENVVMPT